MLRGGNIRAYQCKTYTECETYFHCTLEHTQTYFMEELVGPQFGTAGHNSLEHAQQDLPQDSAVDEVEDAFEWLTQEGRGWRWDRYIRTK